MTALPSESLLAVLGFFRDGFHCVVDGGVGVVLMVVLGGVGWCWGGVDGGVGVVLG